MPTAKDIRVAPISAADARRVIKRLHYSGKVTNNAQLHLGVYLADRLEGAMQFGPSLDKRKIQSLVRGTAWNEFLELNRMAFSETLPRNSESRALSVAFRLIRAHYPHVRWVVSFADATQCGDGTIYRAAGFDLTAIKPSTQLIRMPDGDVFHKIVFEDGNHGAKLAKRRYGKPPGQPVTAWLRAIGATPVPGYQFRYIYFLDRAYRDRLTVPVIPYADIPAECRMYRGNRASEAGDDPHPEGTAAGQH